MPQYGFFSLSTLVSKEPQSKIAQCGACGLFRSCESPKMEPTGKGHRKVLIIGEAPGSVEDEKGYQFAGKTGKHLERTLAKLGVDMRKDCILENAARCRPTKNKLPPTAIDYCRPNVLKTLDDYKPEIIIPMGGPAVKSLIGAIWKEDVGKITRWTGYQIPCQRYNAWICPTFHPSYVVRSEKEKPVVQVLFEKHLEAAFDKDGRPWETIPDYKSQIERIHAPEDAARAIYRMQNSRMIAFDYETNMLKPDSERAHIVCCSVSNGKRTIAFPWVGEAIDAIRDLLRSDVPKIGANIQFETRWSKAKLGIWIRNWLWDVMVNGHILDCRKGVSGLKFQTFAYLGAEAYNDHIEPFLRSKKKGGNSINRVKDIAMSDLLLYCGYDSLSEWLIAKEQMQKLSIDLP